MLTVPRPVVPSLDDDRIPGIREDAAAIEHALHTGHLTALGLLADAAVVSEIAWQLHEAELRHVTIAALAAGDYDDAPAAYCRRWLTCLWRACQLNRAEELYPLLTGARRCARPGCDATDLALYGRRLWCARHAAEQIPDALISETGGDDG
jgi:hypothetical protein